MKYKIPLRDIQTYVNIIDTRDIIEVAYLQGRLKMPLPITTSNGHKVRWKIPELKEKPVGVLTDVTMSSLCINFPIVERGHGQDRKGKDLPFNEIVNLFLRYDPNLKLIRKEVR